MCSTDFVLHSAGLTALAPLWRCVVVEGGIRRDAYGRRREAYRSPPWIGGNSAVGVFVFVTILA